jgi:hypothetical protein
MEERGVTNTGAITATRDDEIGKMAPSLRVAAKIRSGGVVVLLFGTTEPFRSVLPDRIFARDALHPGRVNRPYEN